MWQIFGSILLLFILFFFLCQTRSPNGEEIFVLVIGQKDCFKPLVIIPTFSNRLGRYMQIRKFWTRDKKLLVVYHTWSLWTGEQQPPSPPSLREPGFPPLVMSSGRFPVMWLWFTLDNAITISLNRNHHKLLIRSPQLLSLTPKRNHMWE